MRPDPARPAAPAQRRGAGATGASADADDAAGGPQVNGGVAGGEGGPGPEADGAGVGLSGGASADAVPSGGGGVPHVDGEPAPSVGGGAPYPNDGASVGRSGTAHASGGAAVGVPQVNGGASAGAVPSGGTGAPHPNVGSDAGRSGGAHASGGSRAPHLNGEVNVSGGAASRASHADEGVDGGRFAGVREGWGFFRRRRGVVGRLAAWSVLEAGQTLLAGYAPARALDAGFLAHRPLTGLGWLGVAAVAVPAGAYGTGRVYRNVAALAEPLRDALVRRVVARGVRRAEAAAVSRLTHQVEIARDTFAGLVLLARSFVFTAVGALTGLLLLDPLLLVVVVPPLAVGLALFAATLRPMARRQEAFLTADEAIAAELALVSGGLRDVTAAGAEDRVAAGAGALIDAEYRAARRLAWWSVVRAAAPVAGGRLPVVLLLALAPWLTGRGVTPGALVGALTYLTQSLQPALQTLTHGLGTGGSRLTVVLRRLLRGADASPRPAPVPPGGPPPGAPAVELRGVTFGYGPGAEPVVRGLDLTVPHGGHLAVVGPSGVGKSTVTALIAGVLVADAGRIRVCGAPPGPPAHRVLIPQEAYVFTGTVRDNLGYLREDPVADDEARAAAEAVGAARLIDRLGGLDAPLDPAALAAGERQLIALARAFLSPAPVVLLDEATCHLDPAAEARAERAFAARPGGTLIVVAHRIASARRAGRVLVMDGPHTDCGTHQELLDRSARYRDLVGAWDGRADAEAGAEEEAPEAATGTERVGRSHPAGPL